MTVDDDGEVWVTIGEAEQRTGVNEKTIRDRVARGWLPTREEVVRLRPVLLVNLDDVRRICPVGRHFVKSSRAPSAETLRRLDDVIDSFSAETSGDIVPNGRLTRWPR